MIENSFLDTGVILAYCFTLDKHFNKVKRYIQSNHSEYSFYYSKTVEGEFAHRKIGLNRELSRQVLDHRKQVASSNYQGLLDQMDIREIRKKYLNRGSDVFNSLANWYDNLPMTILKDELVDRLDKLAQQMEANAIQRKDNIDKMAEIWEPDEDVRKLYSKTWGTLSDIPKDDRIICLEAHDLAHSTESPTEFATVNPKDFFDDGMEDAIRSETDISSIEPLASR